MSTCHQWLKTMSDTIDMDVDASPMTKNCEWYYSCGYQHVAYDWFKTLLLIIDIWCGRTLLSMLLKSYFMVHCLYM
jgi:hypothetical protein